MSAPAPRPVPAPAAQPPALPGAGAEAADRARKAETPWRGWSPKGTPGQRKPPVRGTHGTNATLQRRAMNQMSVLELEVGITEAEHDAWHAEQRAIVFAKYGVKK